MRACVLQGGGFSVHSQVCLYSLASHEPLQVCTGRTLRSGAPLPGPDAAFNRNRERDAGHPEPPGLTHRQQPFVLTKKKQTFYIICFLRCSVRRADVGSQLADVVLSLWVVSHLHTVTVSWLKLCSRISVVSVEGAGVLCIQEWLMMSSKDGRSAGRRDRHHLMSCWHSEGKGRGGG